MNIFKRANKVVDNFKWYDISILKLCVISLTLLAAKIRPAILQFHWGYYAGVFGVTYLYLLYKIIFESK